MPSFDKFAKLLQMGSYFWPLSRTNCFKRSLLLRNFDNEIISILYHVVVASNLPVDSATPHPRRQRALAHVRHEVIANSRVAYFDGIVHTLVEHFFARARFLR